MTEVGTTIDKLTQAVGLLQSNRDYLESLDPKRENPEGEELTYVMIRADDYSLDFTVRGPQAREVMRELRRRLRRGVTWTKDVYGNTFAIQTPWEKDRLLLRIDSARDNVCERRITGTETVTIPAVEAQPERTEEREIVEWDCGNLLEEEALA